jgi:H+-transporting ATPase
MGPGHFQRVMSSIGVTLLVLCVRPSICSQETMIRGVYVFTSVILWLLAIWIGGFFRGVDIATPKDNNLLVYTLILLVSAPFIFYKAILYH